MFYIHSTGHKYVSLDKLLPFQIPLYQLGQSQTLMVRQIAHRRLRPLVGTSITKAHCQIQILSLALLYPR